MNTQNILGFDPGRDKCGIAVMKLGKIIYHQTVDAVKAIAIIKQLWKKHDLDLVVMGDGTTSKQWQKQIASSIPNLAIAIVDEKNSTVEARDRYWLMYPPQGLSRLIPAGLRTPPRPVDDIVAILLIERYLNKF